MQDRERLNQLRVMRERLDRLEASPERDWMLAEVRRRAVDLESEGRAAPLRPRVVEPELEPPPVKRAASRPRLKAQPVAPAPRPAVAVQSSAPLPEGVLLCLGDDVLVSPQPGPQGSMVPWARGLRG